MEDRDKRDYYRLSDTILVDYKIASEADTNAGHVGDFFTSDPKFHLLRDIYELQLESKQLISSISQADRVLARFLANLDQRVELIAKASMGGDIDDFSMRECDAEISEGGISFLSQALVPTGQYIALQMLFLPSYLGLVCFGQVRHCQLEDNEYRIGVQFIDADDQTSRIISRHIVSKQSEQRRARLRNF